MVKLVNHEELFLMMKEKDLLMREKILEISHTQNLEKR